MTDRLLAKSVRHRDRVEPDVSVLIVGYNCCALLTDALEHLFRSEGDFTYEVLFVENGHGDNTLEVVGDQFPTVQIIENQTNLGFGAGNNVLAKHARGRYVLLLNPDTQIDPSAIKHLLAFADAHPELGAAGGTTHHPDGTIESSCAQPGPSYPVALLNAVGLGRLCRSVIDIPAHPVQARILSGAFMLVPREVWERLDGFDESFFMYNEETDLCLRIAELGKPLWLIPSARVVHLVGSGDGLRPKRILSMTISGMHLTRRRFAKWRWPLTAAIILLHSGVRYFGSFAATPFIGFDRAKRLREAFGPLFFHPTLWWFGYDRQMQQRQQRSSGRKQVPTS